MFSMLNMSGKELRAKRESAGLKAYVLAAEMGVASSRVSQIEALAIVTDESAERYLAAVTRCSLNTSEAITS